MSVLWREKAIVIAAYGLRQSLDGVSPGGEKSQKILAFEYLQHNQTDYNSIKETIFMGCEVISVRNQPVFPGHIIPHRRESHTQLSL